MNTTVSNDTGKTSEGGTLSSNTGLKSQDFEIGLDWIDFSFREVGNLSEAMTLINAVAQIASDEIDFCHNRAAFNGRSWDGSGCGVAGTKVWWASPESEQSNEKDLSAFYLPPQWLPFTDAAVNDLIERLPSGCELLRSEEKNIVVSPNGSAVVGHGYSVIRKQELVSTNTGVLKFALSGKVMQRVKIDALISLLGCRDDLKVHRIDIALDDLKRRFSLDNVEQAAISGDFFDVGFTAVISSGARKEKRGKTVYFGSPSSDKRLRVYDKEIESGGAKLGIRWEVELRRDKANTVFSQLSSSFASGAKHLASLLRNLVVGAVDFRDRSNDEEKNRDRCRPLDWWLEFKAAVNAAGVKISVPTVSPMVQKNIDWLRKQVAPSLAVVVGVLKIDAEKFVSDLIAEGNRRLSNARRELMQSTLSGDLCY
jgi:hypothetical protein